MIFGNEKWIEHWNQKGALYKIYINISAEIEYTIRNDVLVNV